MSLRLILIVACFLQINCLHSQKELKKFYHENGQVASEGLIINGLPQGVWKNYSPAGQLISKGKRQNGAPDSVWIFFDENECKEKQITFNNQQKNGPYLEFNQHEQIVFKAFYVNDTLQGPYQKFENGVMIEEGQLENGAKNGVVQQYNSNGLLEKRLVVNDGKTQEAQTFNQLVNGNKEGLWLVVNDEGETVYQFYKNGELQQNQKEKDFRFKKDYYPNGELKSQVVIRNGRRNGIQRNYDALGNPMLSQVYQNDTLTAEGYFDRNGEKDSLWTFFNEDAVITATGFYQAGLKTGEWTYFFPDGTIEQQGGYLEGKVHGQWTWYYAEGGIRRVEAYYKGQPDGLKEEFGPTGEKVLETTYAFNEQEGDYFYFVGDHLEEGQLQNGLREGKWVYTFANGSKAFKGRYKDGRPDGKHIYWYDSGKRKAVYRFKKGKKQGTQLEYFPDGRLNHQYYYKNGRLLSVDNIPVVKD